MHLALRCITIGVLGYAEEFLDHQWSKGHCVSESGVGQVCNYNVRQLIVLQESQIGHIEHIADVFLNIELFWFTLHFINSDSVEIVQLWQWNNGTAR